MKSALRILCLLDNQGDVDRVRAALSGSHRPRDLVVVKSREDFLASLESSEPDVIIADPEIASFNGKSALSLTREICEDLPFIFISEQLEAGLIVDSLKAGASDFVFKGNFDRLSPAVERALRERDHLQEQRRKDKALRESEALHRTVLTFISDAVFVTDDSGKFTFVCPNANVIFGHSAEEIWKMGNIAALLGDNFLDSKPDPEGAILENLERVVHDKHGNEKVLLVNIRRVDIEPGTLLISCRDITRRKSTERALLHSQEQLTTLIGNLPGIAYLCHNTPDYEMEFISEGCHELTGYRASDFIERRIAFGDIIHQDDRDYVCEEVAKALKQNKRFTLTYRIICANGEEKWVWEQGCRSPRSTDDDVFLEGLIQDITAQKQATEEVRFQARMLDSVEQAVIATHPDGTIFYWNQFAERLYGWSREEAIGRNVIGFTTTPPEHKEAEEIIQQLRGGKSWTGEFDVTDKSGRVFPALVTDTPMLDEDGNLVAIIGVSSDISEQKKAEAALQESEERYRLAVDQFPHTFAIYDKNRRFKFVNARGVEVSGYREQELIGRRDEELFPDNVTEQYIPLLKRAIETRSPQNGECRIEIPTGTYCMVINYVPIVDVQGEIKQIIGIAQDITERKKAEDALEKSRTLLAEATRIANIGAWEIDIPERRCFLSDEFLRIHGLANPFASVDEILPLTHPDDREKVMQAVEDMMQNGKDYEMEHRIVRQDDGEIRFIRSRGTVMLDAGGRPLKVYGAAKDITMSKKAEEALSESEKRYRTLFEESLDAIYISTPEGRFLDINPAGVELLGYDCKEEVLQLDIVRQLYLNPQDRERFQQTLERAEHVRDFEVVLKRKDGREIQVLETGSVVYDESGNRVAYRGIMRDVSRQKQLEQQIMQMQKMEAVGTLAGGIAHDFNNILAAILGYTEMTIEDLPGDHSNQEDLQEILSAVHRGKALVKQILTFCHGAEKERQPVKLQPIIYETLRLLKATLPANISIRKDIPETAGGLMAAPTQIHQVVMNLCMNAYHAMRAMGGELQVSLAETEFDEEHATNTAVLPPGAYLELTVADTGHGMTPEVLGKIFDPFFTTKPIGEGSGMGLSVVHGIVRSHGGAITVRSQPGQGSTFMVYFPITSLENEAAAAQREKLPVGKERILFVDDEPALIKVAKRSLERYGYKLTTTQSGDEAVRAFRERPHQFDLVITDQNMPGMLGVEVAQEVLRVRSDVPIILTTGYSDKIDEETARKLGIREYLMKPFVAHELGKTIRRVLDET